MNEPISAPGPAASVAGIPEHAISKPGTPLAKMMEWEQCQRITDLPGVHGALHEFSEDATGDNGVYVVREVLRAIAQAAQQVSQPAPVMGQERVAFEAWFSGEVYSDPSYLIPRHDDPNTYVSDVTEVRWLGWQARAALSAPIPAASAHPDHSELARQVIEDTNATLTEQSAIMRAQQKRIVELESLLVARQPDKGRDAAMLDLREFKEGQWWVKELDEAVQNGTDDQKRAVAVVRNMLKVSALAAYPPGPDGRKCGRPMAVSAEQIVSLYESMFPRVEHDRDNVMERVVEFARALLAIDRIAGSGASERWMMVVDGHLIISRCEWIFPDARDGHAGPRDAARYAAVERMDGDIVLSFDGALKDAEHVGRMLDYDFHASSNHTLQARQVAKFVEHVPALTSHDNADERTVRRAMQRSGRGFSSGDEVVACDIGYVLGWNAYRKAVQEKAAQYAPDVVLPQIGDQEMTALRRFHECATDGEGYDVSKDMMRRLACIGLVRRTSGAIYEHTDFGLFVLGEYLPTEVHHER